MDKRKKRPRNSSREDASIDGIEEDSDQLPDTEAKVGLMMSGTCSYACLYCVNGRQVPMAARVDSDNGESIFVLFYFLFRMPWY